MSARAALNMVGQQTRRVLRRTVKSRWGWGVREKRVQRGKTYRGEGEQIPFPQIFRYVAGRIISAPTFSHTFCQRPGRRGRRPLQFIPEKISKPPGGRGRKTDLVAVWFGYVAGRIISAPTHRFRICCPNHREAEGGLPYNSLPLKCEQTVNISLCP